MAYRKGSDKERAHKLLTIHKSMEFNRTGNDAPLTEWVENLEKEHRKFGTEVKRLILREIRPGFVTVKANAPEVGRWLDRHKGNAAKAVFDLVRENKESGEAVKPDSIPVEPGEKYTGIDLAFTPELMDWIGRQKDVSRSIIALIKKDEKEQEAREKESGGKKSGEKDGANNTADMFAAGNDGR